MVQRRTEDPALAAAMLAEFVRGFVAFVVMVAVIVGAGGSRFPAEKTRSAR